VFTRSPEPLPYAAPRPLTASVQRVRLRDPGDLDEIRRRSAPGGWQRQAWDAYDAVAEVKYAFNLLGSVTSRIRLYPAWVADPLSIPVPLSDVPDDLPAGILEAVPTLLGRLSSSRGGQSALLREMAVNLSVTGECYLVQSPESVLPHRTQEDWSIRSTDELVLDPRGRPAVRSTSEARPQDYRTIPRDAFVGRIWRSHPRWSDEAESSMRGGVTDLCADLVLLTRAARATARSRLNAGAIYLPDGLSAAASAAPDGGGAAQGEERDEFEDEFLDALVTPIADDEAASAVVPLIIRGPAELADKIKQFKFERSFDPALAERADRLLERVLQGIDVPKDVVTGLANVRYSNAIAIDESLYKAHVEPLALLIADTITMIWIRPALRELGFPEEQVMRAAVWYDPSEVVMKPDKSADADSGYDRYLISGRAWRRAHGFSELDVPDGEELAYRMLVDKGQILPETSEMLLTRFAPDVMGTAAGPGALPPGALPPGAPAQAPAPAPGEGPPPDAAAGLPPEVEAGAGVVVIL
jgi:hypothetical protein